MRRRSSILYIPPTTFAPPLPLLTSPLPSSLWQADSRHWPLTLCLLSREKVTVYVCVCLGVHTYSIFLYMCVCVCVFVWVRVCRSVCARGNMCLNCQQREYTAKNKNSSVSIQCVCACPYFVPAVSLCSSLGRRAWDGEVYLVCAVNGDKQRRGRRGREEPKCHVEISSF